MSSADPLSPFRDILDAPRPFGQIKPMEFSFRKVTGSYPRFRGTQEIRSSIVGNSGPEHILVETFDQRDGELKLVRFLEVEMSQVPDLLAAILQGEVSEADICVAATSGWPDFPVILGEIPYADGSNLNVLLDQYKGRLEIKLSKSLAGVSTRRSGQWCKFGGAYDARAIMVLFINAFDEIQRSADADALSSAATSEQDIPF